MALFTSQVGAQEAEREEMVVTGSYIKRDTFNAPSPTEVIDSKAVAESGAPTMGNFIRDLTFTQNTDTVANVLGSQDGGQDSNSATFNIRGLGTGSTLTLFDGRRIVGLECGLDEAVRRQPDVEQPRFRRGGLRCGLGTVQVPAGVAAREEALRLIALQRSATAAARRVVALPPHVLFA